MMLSDSLCKSAPDHHRVASRYLLLEASNNEKSMATQFHVPPLPPPRHQAITSDGQWTGHQYSRLGYTHTHTHTHTHTDTVQQSAHQLCRVHISDLNRTSSIFDDFIPRDFSFGRKKKENNNSSNNNNNKTTKVDEEPVLTQQDLPPPVMNLFGLSI